MFQIHPPILQPEPIVWRASAIAGSIAIAVAIVIALLTAAVAASETDRDLIRMLAVGGDPKLRPRVRARQAAYHTTLAVLLAVPAGLVLAVAIRAATAFHEPFTIPWEAIVLLAVVAPVAVATPLRIATRRATPVSRRRPT